jgi:hypothetical protein
LYRLAHIIEEAMKVFDMSTMPVTKIEFIRVLCMQSTAAGRAEEITKADAEAVLGLNHLISGAPYDCKTPPQEKLL